MSWGNELWDQGNNIASHTKRGIEFLDRYASFLTERYKVENEYAKQLKLLTSKYTPKRRDDEDCQFSHRNAFFGMLNELNDIANQHERIADQFRDEVVIEIGQLSRRLREQRKENLEEAVRLENQLNSSTESMQKTMKDYNRAFKESEAAKLKYDRADQDMHLSRAEVLKAKNNCISKQQQAEEAKNTYALQLQRTNEFQHEYYTRLLPAVLERSRELDEYRVSEFSRLLTKCVNIERNVLPIVEKCLQGMLEQATLIDAKADTAAVVQRYKSGFVIPGDYPFDDPDQSSSTCTYSMATESASNGGANENGYGYGYRGSSQIPRSPAVGGTRKLPQRKPSAAGSIVSRVQNARRGKLANLFRSKSNEESFKDDYSDLPPQQQCKRLTQRVELIKKQIETKLAQKDGLARMQSVYRDSPHLGDAAQVDAELQKCNGELSSLQAELTKFQAYLKAASCRLSAPVNAISSGESVSSSSFSSFSPTPVSTPRAPPPNRPPPPTGKPPTGKPPHGQQEGDDHANEESVEGSECDYSDGACLAGENATQKSRTPTPSFSGQEYNAISTTLTPCSKVPVTLSASPESGLGSAAGSSSSGVALALAEEYDDWTHSDNDRDAGLYLNHQVNSAAKNILGTCTALYDFAGDGEGMVSIKEGEELLLLERDAGDGWTKVRKRVPVEDGFVPSSYLDCKWYPEE